MKRRSFIKRSTFTVGAAVPLGHLVSTRGHAAASSDEENDCLISKTRTWKYISLAGYATHADAAAAGRAYINGLAHIDDCPHTDSENWGPSEDCTELDPPVDNPVNPKLSLYVFQGLITGDWIFKVEGTFTRTYCST